MLHRVFARWIAAGIFIAGSVSQALAEGDVNNAPDHAFEWGLAERVPADLRIGDDLGVGAHTFYGLNSDGDDRVTFLANTPTASYVTALTLSDRTLVGKAIIGQPQDKEYRAFSAPFGEDGVVSASTLGPIAAYDLRKAEKHAEFSPYRGIDVPVGADSKDGYSVFAFQRDKDTIFYLLKGNELKSLKNRYTDDIEAISIGDIDGDSLTVGVAGKTRMNRLTWVFSSGQSTTQIQIPERPTIWDPDARWSLDTFTLDWIRAEKRWTCCSWLGKDHDGVMAVQLQRRVGNEHDGAVYKIAEPDVTRTFIHRNGGVGVIMDIEGDCRGRSNNKACYLAVSVDFRKIPGGTNEGFVVFLDGDLKPIGRLGGPGFTFHDLMTMPDGTLAAVGSRITDGVQNGIFYHWKNPPYGASF